MQIANANNVSGINLRTFINIELIALCASGNRGAQKQLYQLLLPYLNALCKRYLNDQSVLKDVLQETFISLFLNIHKYDAAKASFKTWATKIAINFCLKQNQKNKKWPTAEFLLSEHDLPAEPDVFKKLTDEEILKELKKMPENYYEVFNLYVIDGFSHKEIAEMLNIEPSLSRQRLTRGREWLKKKLPHELKSLSIVSNN